MIIIEISQKKSFWQTYTLYKKTIYSFCAYVGRQQLTDILGSK